jgi:SAM-dependent methyltransferase
MFAKEALWLAEALAAFPAEELSPLLDIGSGTLQSRVEDRPWTERDLLAPLRRRGVEIVHLDQRIGDGIDIKADLLADGDFARVRERGYRAILCCNVLEHVADAREFARRCLDLAPGGLLIVTVPRSYPRHGDPIDTMFRPDLHQLAALFPGTELVTGTVLDVGESYRDAVRRRPWILLRHVFRLPFPFLGFEKWKHSMRKPYWLVANYKVTVAVFRHSAADAAAGDPAKRRVQAASISG